MRVIETRFGRPTHTARWKAMGTDTLADDMRGGQSSGSGFATPCRLTAPSAVTSG